MALFFTYAPGWVVAAYAAAALMTVAYTWWKLAVRRYLFSPYTVVIYTIAFALLVVAPFQYVDQAWQVLSPTLTAGPFVPYLNLSIGINSIGFVIVMACVWIVEVRSAGRQHPPLIPRPPLIAITTVAAVLVIGILVFMGCLAAVGTVPLFGGRTVFNESSSLRPVYNFANYLILFTTSVLIVWSFIARSRRYTPLIIAGLICMLFTGGRTSFLSTMQLLAFMFVYQRNVGRPRRATAQLFGFVALIAVIGLFLASFRAGQEFSIDSVLDVALYGNTFSDIRDGAYVASAWDIRMSNESLGGNTYLAGLLSFIPSSLSTFRETWSWGYFTTTSLFGWEDHYGFRGGWSLEMFMNFGLPGVIIAAVACGWLLGRLESLFYTGVIRDQAGWFPNAYLWSWVGYGLFTVLIASSATYNLYSLVLIIGLLLVLSLLRRTLHERLGVHKRGKVDLGMPMMAYSR